MATGGAVIMVRAAYTMAWEPLGKLLEDGLDTLMHQAWHEAQIMPDVLPYNPNWDYYLEIERTNLLRWVALRVDGRLVGYANAWLTPHIHSRQTWRAAVQDVFIATEHRSGGRAEQLLTFLEKELVKLGAKIMIIAERYQVGNGALGRFYRRLGFRAEEQIWTKKIGSA